MDKKKKWTVKDVITTVLLSAVLIVIQLVVNMVCMANDFVSMVLSVGITMFLCAPVYMLMVSRIGKRFVTLIYMTLLGVIFLLMGNWFLLPYFIVTGVICEVILWKRGACGNPKRMTAAWTAARSGGRARRSVRMRPIAARRAPDGKRGRLRRFTAA